MHIRWRRLLISQQRYLELLRKPLLLLLNAFRYPRLHGTYAHRTHTYADGSTTTVSSASDMFLWLQRMSPVLPTFPLHTFGYDYNVWPSFGHLGVSLQARSQDWAIVSDYLAVLRHKTLQLNNLASDWQIKLNNSMRKSSQRSSCSDTVAFHGILRKMLLRWLSIASVSGLLR